MLFVGDDWAEDHHDVEIQDESGHRLAKARLPEGVAGMGRLHALLGEHLDSDADSGQVAVGIESDRGPWVRALVAAGYQVFAVNPLQAARFRQRRSVSGPRAMPLTRTPWPTWSAPTGTSSARSPETLSWPRRSRWSPGRTRH